MTTMSDVLQNRFAIFMTMFQLLMLLFFGLFTTYSEEGYAETSNARIEDDPTNQRGVGYRYAMFQDVHVMMFIGFGFLMTFMRRNCFNSVGLTFLLGAQVIQWCLLCRGFFEQALTGHKWHKIPLNLDGFVFADYGLAAVLISYGGVLGKLGPFELVFMAFVEIVVYALNEALCVEKFETADVGGSMYIHVFGAYFGLSLSMIISKKEARSEKSNSSYTTDTFAMIGTLFLWLFWPSFNGAMATGSSQHRVVINTILSLCGACVSTFAVSSLFRHGNKFDMVEVQNATLAGGVAVGCAADFIIRPWGAILIGMTAGTLSTLGFIFLQPWLERKIGLHDSCGIHNLHGMPGILGGVAGIVASAVATDDLYGTSAGKIFPARAPSDPVAAESLGIEPGKDRSASTQAWYQLAALLLSLGLAIAGGILTGVILKFSRVFPRLERDYYFDDSPFWHINHPTVEDDDKTIHMHELPKTTV